MKACSSKWSSIGKLLGKIYLSSGFLESKPSLSLIECEGVSALAYDVVWEVLSRWVYGKTIEEAAPAYDPYWGWGWGRERVMG